jgi:hypothetical protein
MAITFNEIAELVARFGNSVVTEQANMAAPFVGKGIIKKESHTGTVGIVNVKGGGINSTGFIADGGALPEGENIQPHQLAYHPKALFSRLSIPRIAALTAVSKQDGVNLVKEQMESVGADLGRTLGRAVFKSGSITRPFAAGNLVDAAAGAVGTPRAISLASAANQDLSPYRIGAAFVGATYTQTNPATAAGALAALVVSSINYNTGVVTFTPHTIVSGAVGPALLAPNTGALSVTTFATASLDVLRPADGGALANSMTSLLDLASAAVAPAGTTLGTAGNYAGLSAANTPDYCGSDVAAAGGNLTIEKLDELSQKVKRRSGKPWTHTVMNSTNMHNYMSLLVSQRRFVGGNQSADASTSSMATYEGKPIIVDENMPDSTVLLFTQSDVKLAQWRDFQPDSDGTKAAMVSDTSFIYDTQIFGMYNLRATARHGLGILTGITGATWTV